MKPLQPPPGFIRPKPGRPKSRAAEEANAATIIPTKANDQQSPAPQPPEKKKRGRKPGSRGHRSNKAEREALLREHQAREAYRLYYIERKTLKEIGEVFKRSITAVHHIIAEEKRRLRGAFTEDALDHFNLALFELFSLYGQARDNYTITGDARHASIADKAMDKIIKLAVGYLPEKKEFGGSVNLNHEHGGTVTLDERRTRLLEIVHTIGERVGIGGDRASVTGSGSEQVEHAVAR